MYTHGTKRTPNPQRCKATHAPVVTLLYSYICCDSKSGVMMMIMILFFHFILYLYKFFLFVKGKKREGLCMVLSNSTLHGILVEPHQYRELLLFLSVMPHLLQYISSVTTIRPSYHPGHYMTSTYHSDGETALKNFLFWSG